MKAKVRGYEGIILYLDSTVNAVRDYLGNVVRAIRYQIVILCDDGAKVELADVSPEEIEVLT